MTSFMANPKDICENWQIEKPQIDNNQVPGRSFQRSPAIVFLSYFVCRSHFSLFLSLSLSLQNMLNTLTCTHFLSLTHSLSLSLPLSHSQIHTHTLLLVSTPLRLSRYFLRVVVTSTGTNNWLAFGVELRYYPTQFYFTSRIRHKIVVIGVPRLCFWRCLRIYKTFLLESFQIGREQFSCSWE